MMFHPGNFIATYLRREREFPQKVVSFVREWTDPQNGRTIQVKDLFHKLLRSSMPNDHETINRAGTLTIFFFERGQLRSFFQVYIYSLQVFFSASSQTVRAMESGKCSFKEITL